VYYKGFWWEKEEHLFKHLFRFLGLEPLPLPLSEFREGRKTALNWKGGLIQDFSD